jgi:drug/metabolite transporter (DMT)-like permease
LQWASSYIAAKIGLADITPFAFVAVRLTIAAFAAGAMIAMMRRAWPAASRWPHLMLGGALAHGLALSTAHAALVTVDATPTALVHAFHPILTASLGVALLHEKFSWWQWLGVALGLVGVMLGVPLTASPNALVLLGLSLFGLSGGTLYLKAFCADVPPFEATAVQLIGGAALSLLAMLFFETPQLRWSVSLAAAMAWNVVMMSILGMAIYNFLLDRHGAGKASSGFFVVPGASALMAWLLLDEQIAPSALLGLAAATLGVVLVWLRPRTR